MVSKVRSLLAEAQALSARLAAFNEIAVAMQASLDTDAMLRTMAQQARWVLDFQCCAVVLRDDNSFRYQALHGPATPPNQGAVPWRPDPALADVLMYGYPKVLHDQPALSMPPDMCSAILVPLYDQGAVIGSLNFYATDPRRYKHDDLRIAFAIALQASAVLRNARLYTDATRTCDELHTIIESISDAVLVLDKQGRVVHANRALQTMLHRTAPPAGGQCALWLAKARDKQRRRLISAQHARTALASMLHASGTNTLLPLEDGRFIEWVCVPIVGSGALSGYVLSGRDVTARMALEELRDEQIHMIVHDLRAPVSGMLLGLELLELDHQEGKPLDIETIVAIRSSATNLLKRINTTLEVKQLQAGQFALQRQPIAINEPIERAVAAMLPLANAQKQSIALTIEDAIPIFSIDSALIQRVLENLISNALKFMEGPGCVHVYAECSASGNEVELLVRDTGPGVPERLKRRIFDKYGRGGSRVEGNGLGLAFCQYAVEAHGGSIGVLDAPGGGAVFWFTLPIAALHHTGDQ